MAKCPIDFGIYGHQYLGQLTSSSLEVLTDRVVKASEHGIDIIGELGGLRGLITAPNYTKFLIVQQFVDNVHELGMRIGCRPISVWSETVYNEDEFSSEHVHFTALAYNSMLDEFYVAHELAKFMGAAPHILSKQFDGSRIVYYGGPQVLMQDDVYCGVIRPHKHVAAFAINDAKHRDWDHYLAMPFALEGLAQHAATLFRSRSGPGTQLRLIVNFPHDVSKFDFMKLVRILRAVAAAGPESIFVRITNSYGQDIQGLPDAWTTIFRAVAQVKSELTV
jgi:hypothetical protein